MTLSGIIDDPLRDACNYLLIRPLEFVPPGMLTIRAIVAWHNARLSQELLMPKFLKSLAVLLALPLVLVGCKINSINYFPPKPAHIRVVNALGSTTPINVAANGVTAWTNLGFEAMTGYLDFDNVDTKITVTLAGSTTTLIEQSYPLTGDQSYTLVVFGTTSVPSLGIISDAVQAPSSGHFQLNVFAAAPVGNGIAVGLYPVDIYLTTPGQSLDTISPILSNVNYANRYIVNENFSEGVYQLRMTTLNPNTNIKTVVYDSGSITFAGSTATDLILYSRGSTVLPNVMLNDSDGAGLQRIANNLLARIKVVNGAFQNGNVNLLLNGTAIVTDLEYNTASTYKTVAAGAATVTFEASAAPGAPIASLSNTFLGATDQTVFVSGFAGSTVAVALRDNNLPPASSAAAIRYVNASPDAGTLDAYANDVLQWPSIATNAASDPVLIVSGAYTVTFKDHATGLPVLPLPSLGFNALQNYSVYVLGPAGTLKGLATADSP
jgi:hypothetical protein